MVSVLCMGSHRAGGGPKLGLNDGAGTVLGLSSCLWLHADWGNRASPAGGRPCFLLGLAEPSALTSQQQTP